MPIITLTFNKIFLTTILSPLRFFIVIISLISSSEECRTITSVTFFTCGIYKDKYSIEYILKY